MITGSESSVPILLMGIDYGLQVDFSGIDLISQDWCDSEDQSDCFCYGASNDEHTREGSLDQ